MPKRCGWESLTFAQPFVLIELIKLTRDPELEQDAQFLNKIKKEQALERRQL
jgi:hypothetical protein